MMADNWGEAPPSQAVMVAALKAGLAAEGDTTHVGTKAPRDTENPSARRIRVSRIAGGSETFATDSARFLIECWDPSELAAEQLVNKVRRLLKQCRGQRFAGAFIHGSRATSLPVNFPDPGTSSARFQFTGELTIGLL